MTDSLPDLVTIATFITALATLATVCVLVWQARIAKKTTQAEFTLRLHDNFFLHPRNEKIIRAIDEGQSLLKKNGGQFIEADLDDYLGMLELLDIYMEEGALTKKTVRNMFGYYIVTTWKNSEIRDYVKEVRLAEQSEEYYDRVEKLAKEFECA